MDRIKFVKAAVFGLVAADAVGVPTEFQPRQKLMANPITDMVGYGTHDMPKGTWSDDSSMALCTLQSMIVKKKLDLDDIMQKFVRWEDEDWMTPHGEVFDIGRTCLQSIERYLDGADISSCGGRNEHDNGNGSLMRIAPVSLYNYLNGVSEEEAYENIRAVSALTHAHERACVGCGIYDIVLRRLADAPEKATVKSALAEAASFFADYAETAHFARLFSADFEDLPLSAIRSSGYVVDTLEAAVWCLLKTDSYRACVLLAANLGEDTDTVAAVAGALAGILYGYDAIPEDWVAALAKTEMIDAMSEAFAAIYG